MPGGSLVSKPTWWNTFGCSATSAFFVLGDVRRSTNIVGRESDGEPQSNRGTADCSSGNRFPTAADGPRAQIGGRGPQRRHAADHAARGLVAGRAGHGQEPGRRRQVQEFHRQLFTNSADELRQEIKRITGVEVREATAEVEPTSGTVVQVFTTGTMVQVFLLAGGVPAGSWSGNGLGERSQKTEVLPC